MAVNLERLESKLLEHPVLADATEEERRQIIRSIKDRDSLLLRAAVTSIQERSPLDWKYLLQFSQLETVSKGVGDNEQFGANLVVAGIALLRLYANVHLNCHSIVENLDARYGLRLWRCGIRDIVDAYKLMVRKRRPENKLAAAGPVLSLSWWLAAWMVGLGIAYMEQENQ